jgi:hypothetical protein
MTNHLLHDETLLTLEVTTYVHLLTKRVVIPRRRIDDLGLRVKG